MRIRQCTEPLAIAIDTVRSIFDRGQNEHLISRSFSIRTHMGAFHSLKRLENARGSTPFPVPVARGDRATARIVLWRYSHQQIALQISVEGECPGGQESLWTLCIQWALPQVILEQLTVPLMGPGMSAIGRRASVAHGQIRLQAVYGAR